MRKFFQILWGSILASLFIIGGLRIGSYLNQSDLDRAGIRADEYVQEQGLGWGRHAEIVSTTEGFIVSYDTPARELRDLGPRQIVVTPSMISRAIQR